MAMDLETGALRKVTENLNRPTGVALAPDEMSAYVVEQSFPYSHLVRIDLCDESLDLLDVSQDFDAVTFA